MNIFEKIERQKLEEIGKEVISLAQKIYINTIKPESTEAWMKAQAKASMRASEIFFEEMYREET